MAYDYTKIQAMALRLVTKYGRQVQAQRYNEPQNAQGKPWEGPGDPLVAESTNVQAVFVEPSGVKDLGLEGMDEGLLKSFDQMGILAQGPGEGLPDLLNFHMLVDKEVTWRLLWIKGLQPGPVNVIYYFGVAR